MIFRQLFEPVSSTGTCVLADEGTDRVTYADRAFTGDTLLAYPQQIDRAVPANQHCGRETVPQG